jgi:hypothetical protein
VSDSREVEPRFEIGQILHNNPVGAPMPDHAEALIYAIRRELARVYWNVNQKVWAGSPDYDPWTDRDKGCTFDPLPPGIEWRPYYNWGGCPEDDDWDQAEAEKPNFAFEGVEIRWYKHFGRSMNANVLWEPDKWVRWFDRCLQTIRAYESDHFVTRHGYGQRTPMPDPLGRVQLTSSEPSGLPPSFALRTIADQIQRWLDWSRKEREQNDPPLTTETEDGTAIMCLPVPSWPTHGQMKNWIAALSEAGDKLDTMLGDNSGERA